MNSVISKNLSNLEISLLEEMPELCLAFVDQLRLTLRVAIKSILPFSSSEGFRQFLNPLNLYSLQTLLDVF